MLLTRAVNAMNDILFQAVLAIFSLSFDAFTMPIWIVFSLLIGLGFKVMDKISSSSTFYDDVLKLTKIKSHRVWSDEDLDIVDHTYVAINRMLTTPIYVYHTAAWYREYTSPGTFSSDLQAHTVLVVVVQCALLFLIYDFIYFWFHRTLHIPALYPFIHKHHHRQVSPFRGTYDGVNTHPVEYLFGLYLHLWSIMLLTWGWPKGGVHCAAILGFYVLSTFFSSWNHTRFAIRIPKVFDSRDHDVHHRWPRSNYAQFIMFWDHLFGTFKSYQELERRGKDKGKSKVN